MRKLLGVLASFLLVATAFGQVLKPGAAPIPRPEVSGRFFDGSDECGVDGPAANWIMATFRNDGSTGGLFEIGFSNDQLNWCPTFLQFDYELRDPRLVKYSGTWYIFYTGAGATTDFGCRSATDPRTDWSAETAISVTGGGLGATATWSPTYYVDSSGTLHVIVAISTSGTTSFQLYEMHPTGSGNLCTGTWSDPTLITVTGESDLIGPWVDCLDTTTDAPCTTSPTTPVYQLFYVAVASTELINYATSSSLLGPYTNVATGDWAGWGSGTSNNTEAPQLLYEGTDSWRMIMDYIVGGGYAAGQLYYSDCTAGATCFTSGSGDWSTKEPLATAPYQAKHGTIYPWP